MRGQVFGDDFVESAGGDGGKSGCDFVAGGKGAFEVEAAEIKDLLAFEAVHETEIRAFVASEDVEVDAVDVRDLSNIDGAEIEQH
ncbi:MAG: hypothetical protein ABSE85_00555 [Candidatus Korobacteraceae bacterium]